MKNWEKYESELKEIGTTFGVSRHSGILYECEVDIACYSCIFANEHSGKRACSIRRMEWLYSDYKEPQPKLTKEERAIIDAFDYTDYCIRRNVAGELWLYAEASQLALKKELFPFITWESNKAWSIAELKELEVECE